MLNFPFPKKTYIFGTGDNDNLVGTYLDEIIYAYDGNDMLNGGGGKDWLYGGLGDDYYIISDTDDKVVEYADQGTDTVYSYITSYTLTDHVEKLQLVGTQALYGTGNGLDNRLTGNDQNNILSALDGNDVLDGRKGMDLMIGGYGDDNYYVDNSGDSIWEFSDQGKDVVHTSATFVLSGHIENLYMQIGAGAIDATGNDLDNYIVGNDSNNILSDGDDTYIVDNPGDVVWEFADRGIDKVYSSVSYELGSNVENLTLLDQGGAIDGTGNELKNHIEGNSSKNVLKGGAGDDWLDGKGGNDTMYGGEDNDIFIADSTNDVAIEYANQGYDKVHSTATYFLPLNVETLILQGNQAIDGFGNDDNNWMWGNNKANSMYGYDGMDQIKAGGGKDVLDGGKGQDDLWGGSDADTFRFHGDFGHDSIHDFKAGGDLDIIELDHNQFADFNAVMSHAQQFGGNVQVKLDATHSIYVDNVNLADLHASDFSFV